MAAVGGEVEDPLGLDVEGDTKFPEDQLMVSVKQCLLCLESRSVGSARFWLPGSGFAKNMRIHESGSKGYNINQKLQKRTFLSLKPKSELLKIRDYKNFMVHKVLG